MKNKITRLLDKKGVHISFKKYFIDAMGTMALGLFSSLLIGTILKTIGEQLNISTLIDISNYATLATGAAMGIAISYSLNAPLLVMFSAATVGIAGNDLGGPLGALIATIIGTEFGKIVSKETKIDILVTPTVTILIGCGIATLIGPAVSKIMFSFGEVINSAMQMQPFAMSILISVIMGIVLTLPISSAALCVMLGIDGLAGGAALAGCCAQMMGFAIASYKENGISGIFAQGLGTSMLQVPNIIKNPAIWLAPILTSAITAPIATLVFKLKIDSTFSVAAGMGTSGLVGPIGLITSMGNTPKTWLGMIIICFIAPTILCFLFDKLFRYIGLVKDGDMQLDI